MVWTPSPSDVSTATAVLSVVAGVRAYDNTTYEPCTKNGEAVVRLPVLGKQLVARDVTPVSERESVRNVCDTVLGWVIPVCVGVGTWWGFNALSHSNTFNSVLTSVGLSK